MAEVRCDQYNIYNKWILLQSMPDESFIFGLRMFLLFMSNEPFFFFEDLISLISILKG